MRSAQTECGPKDGGQSDSSPRVRKQIFASVFSPSWALGLILFLCILLPSYEGCNGETVRVSAALAADVDSPADVYVRFMVVWPFLLGLVICVGTLVLVVSRDPKRAGFLWWSFALLIILNATLLVLALVTETDDSADVWTAVWGAAATILLVLLPFTRRHCRNTFNAAMWLQLILALTAAVCLTFVVPAIFFANQWLIGGKVALACSVLLVPISIVLRLDGCRALTRSSHESPLRLGLKSAILLMLVGGLACAWIGTYMLVDLR